VSLGHGASIVTNGLVLCLDAANPKSYPGSGAVWYDLSGNGNHASLVNGPVYSTENNGKFVLDGINDYVETINPLNLSTTNAVTVLFSVKVLSYGTSPKVLYELGPNFNSYTDCFVASFSDNSVGANYDIFASVRGNVGYNIGVYSKTLLNDSNWHSNIIIHDTSQTSKENLIYSNGVIKDEISNPLSGYANNTNNFGNRKFYIGCRGGASLFGNIEISSVMAYNRALSAAEIQQNFNASRNRFGI
jgi:hypothetical protein